MTTNENLDHCLSCVTRLRLAVRSTAASYYDMTGQATMYARELAQFHPKAVSETCDGLARESEWWPTLATLLARAREEQALVEAAERPRLAPPKPAERTYAMHGKPSAERLATAMDIAASPGGYRAADSLIRMYLGMIEREHGRATAEYHAGQIASVAVPTMRLVLAPWIGEVRAAA